MEVDTFKELPLKPIIMSVEIIIDKITRSLNFMEFILNMNENNGSQIFSSPFNSLR